MKKSFMNEKFHDRKFHDWKISRQKISSRKTAGSKISWNEISMNGKFHERNISRKKDEWKKIVWKENFMNNFYFMKENSRKENLMQELFEWKKIQWRKIKSKSFLIEKIVPHLCLKMLIHRPRIQHIDDLHGISLAKKNLWGLPLWMGLMVCEPRTPPTWWIFYFRKKVRWKNRTSVNFRQKYLYIWGVNFMWKR